MACHNRGSAAGAVRPPRLSAWQVNVAAGCFCPRREAGAGSEQRRICIRAVHQLPVVGTRANGRLRVHDRASGRRCWARAAAGLRAAASADGWAAACRRRAWCVGSACCSFRCVTCSNIAKKVCLRFECADASQPSTTATASQPTVGRADAVDDLLNGASDAPEVPPAKNSDAPACRLKQTGAWII